VTTAGPDNDCIVRREGHRNKTKDSVNTGLSVRATNRDLLGQVGVATWGMFNFVGYLGGALLFLVSKLVLSSVEQILVYSDIGRFLFLTL